jgi:hypothetical protein
MTHRGSEILRLKALIWLFCKDSNHVINVLYIDEDMREFQVNDEKYVYWKKGQGLHVNSGNYGGITQTK